MNIQITVRLPEHLVKFIDDAVAGGESASRAEAVAKALSREQRRKRAIADLERLRDVDGDVTYPEFAGLSELAHRAMDLD